MDAFTEQDSNAESGAEQVYQWGETAPKGGRAVLNRILKEGSNVPLFLGQTFVNSLRDVGYNSTTAAVCEHVDNAIQAGATDVRVYFHQTGKKGSYEVDTLIYDNGKGMPPHVLQVAMSFGGSMYYENRTGIGRFGVGMKTAALSMGPALDVYSWQEPGAYYQMTLDVEDISASRSNLITLPEPTLHQRLPQEVTDILLHSMVYPRDENQQELLAYSEETLDERLDKSGTIIFIPECDRLTRKMASTLVDDATKEMARIYRHAIGVGLRLYVNNRRVKAFDPTYWMENARHTEIKELSETRSRLVNQLDIPIPVEDGSDVTGTASVRLYMLPIEAWYDLPRKVRKNDLQLFEDHLVSFMRNGREVHIGAVSEISGKRHGDAAWLRIQVDFGGDLDEAFGVAMNKQGVRPKKYALDAIRERIKDDVTKVRERTAQYRADRAQAKSKTHVLEAERRANEADPLQGRLLPEPNPQTEEERKALEANLRVLARSYKRDSETDEQAFERIRDSRYITAFRHDPYWPFYAVDYQLGKVILTINTLHPFFTKLYEPLSRLQTGEAGEDGDGADGVPNPESAGNGELLVSLQMLLLSLGRTQSIMTMNDDGGEKRMLFDELQREWSANLKTQLLTS